MKGLQQPWKSRTFVCFRSHYTIFFMSFHLHQGYTAQRTTYFSCNICLAFNYSNYHALIAGAVPRMLTFFLMLLLYRLQRLFASVLPSNYPAEDVAYASDKQEDFVWRIFEHFLGGCCTAIVILLSDRYGFHASPKYPFLFHIVLSSLSVQPL